MELARRADTAAFIQCHVNAIDYLGGVPGDVCRIRHRRTKVITLDWNEARRTIWNQRMLDCALSVGFDARL